MPNVIIRCDTHFIIPLSYADGVDLNCGCPQSWAQRAGLGSALLHEPEKIADMVSTIRRNLPSTFSVSVKIRLAPNSIRYNLLS
jgi:tRNA-dihydrouridine synthase 4